METTPTIVETEKQARKAALAELRMHTNYPNFRFIVNLCAAVSYLIAIIAVFSEYIRLFTGQPEMAVGTLVGIVVAIVAAVSREIFVMLADLADSTLEANRKKGAA